MEQRKPGRFDQDEIEEAWDKLNELDLLMTEEG